MAFKIAKLFQRFVGTFPDYLEVNGATNIGHNQNTSEITWEWNIVVPTTIRKSHNYAQVI